ncbi:MAG: ice-binding family protein [Gemmatimonadales bacterium]
MSGNVTLAGNANDVWIFQIAGGIAQASAARVVLTSGALVRNVFWQVAGVVAIGTTAHSRNAEGPPPGTNRRHSRG